MKKLTDIILTAFLTTVFILMYLLLFSDVRYRHRQNMIENYNHYVSILQFRNGKQRLQDESGKKFGPKADYYFPVNQDDTLVVFKLNNKYGYMNVVTKQVQIGARFQFVYKFDHESGLAAVLTGGKIAFITQSGDFKITPQYPYKKKWNDDYDPEVKFNNGFCKIPSEDGRKFGLINQNNELVLPIIYDSIGEVEEHGLRVVVKEERFGLLDSTCAFLLAPIYNEITINKLGVVVRDATKNTQQLLNFDLTVLSSRVFDEISSMTLEDLSLDEESDDEWNQSYHPDFSTFIIDGNVGLLSKEGVVMIEATFDDIEYFGGKGIFKAQLDEKYFLINSKGQFIH